MAFTCSPPVNHTQITGHHCFLKYCRTGHTLSSAKTIQRQQNHPTPMWGLYSSAFKIRSSSHKVLSLASSGKDVHENSSDSKEESSDSPTKQTIQLNGSEASSSSSTNPFVGAKISSRMAARASEATNNTAPASAAPPPMKSPSSEVTSHPPGNMPPISGTEILKNARASSFLEPRASSKELASKNLLDALKHADLQGKTTKFGQPMVPTNLFDEPSMVPPEQQKFEFTLNAAQLVLVFSFLTIIAIMFGTAYVVWKLGGIHYNEY